MYRRYQLEAEKTLSEISHITDDYFQIIGESGTKQELNIGLNGASEIIFEELDMDKITTLKEECFKRLRTIAAKVTSSKDLVDRENVIEDVRYICNLYSMFENKIPQAELHDFRKEVATIILETGILKFLAKIVVSYPADVYCNIASYKDTQLLFLTISLLLFYTSASDVLTEAVAETAVTRFCKQLLETCTDGHLAQNLSEILEKIIHATISLLQKLSMREASVRELRRLDFTKTLHAYLSSPDEEIGLISMTVLANIISEEDCCIIQANSHLVAKLLYYLQKGLEKGTHSYEGWSAKKCGRAVRKLAKYDANKKLLWNLNALHTLADLAQTGDEDEQLESVHGIWALCFDEDIREDVINDKDLRVINLLQNLQKSTSNEHIKDTCAKCLWTISQYSKTSPETTHEETFTQNTTPQKPSSNAHEGHIMISYQSADRPTLLKIKKILEEKNYKVWMDVDRMGGSTLQAMAEGVENAAVVLLCYSRKYKESENCRLEAEYVHEQHKPFIPLKMEQGYKPDGWLGLMIGSRYFVDFSGKYRFEDKLVDLFRELKRVLEPDAEEKNSNQSKVNQESQLKPTKNAAVMESIDGKESKRYKLEQIKQIRKWNREDVLTWLNENNLNNQGLESLTGEEISFLARVMIEAPDKIYDFLTKDLMVTALLIKSRLVWALDELSNKNNAK